MEECHSSLSAATFYNPSITRLPYYTRGYVKWPLIRDISALSKFYREQWPGKSSHIILQAERKSETDSEPIK